MPKAILRLMVIAAAVMANAVPGKAELQSTLGINSSMKAGPVVEAVYRRYYRNYLFPYYYPPYRAPSLEYSPPVYVTPKGYDPNTGASQYRLPSHGPYYTPH
jgi:hypothetical protein